MQTQHEDLWQITNQSYSVGWKLDISNSSPWGHHWRRPVYGGRQYLEMGRAIRIVGLYHRRAIRLFHHAFNGRNVVPRTGYRFVRRLCASLYEPVLWLSHRLVLLVYVDGGGDSEITAIGVYVQFWFPEMAQWIPALIAVALVALANLAAVRLYGEIEFWFAMIKVTTIIVMIVIGLGVIFFGFGNGGQSIGFSNLTEHGGFFAGGWKGFLTALCIVVASYQGVELIGITAGEAKNPQVTLRSAVGKVLWRILIFYVGAIFVIVTIFPWNEIGSNGSPFVLTFAKIGITAAAGIINFVVLTAALSGCNSGMYSCGRMLYALAKNRQLPAAMAKVSRHGVPVAGVAVSIAILLIGSCLNYIIPNPQRVFVYVYSASVLPGMVPWFVILISQLRFRRAHKAAIASHPFRSILFPWANYVTMAFLICVLIGMYFNEDTRMSLFVGIIFMLAVTAIYKVFGLNRHGKAHKLEE